MPDKFEQNRTLDGRVMHKRIRQDTPHPLDSKSKCQCSACKSPMGEKLDQAPGFDPIAELEAMRRDGYSR